MITQMLVSFGSKLDLLSQRILEAGHEREAMVMPTSNDPKQCEP